MNSKITKPILFLLVAISFISCSEKEDLIADLGTNFCADIQRNDSLSLSKELADISHLMETKTGVYVLEDGAGSMITRGWLTEYAEESINIQYFIFSTDNVGLIACDYLVRAADRGVAGAERPERRGARDIQRAAEDAVARGRQRRGVDAAVRGHEAGEDGGAADLERIGGFVGG